MADHWFAPNICRLSALGLKMKIRGLFILLSLTACGTPQEQCIGAATRDMRVVDRLIAEVQGNLARGYAYENVTVYRPEWLDCTPRATETTPNPAPKLCFDDVPQTVRQAVAIDLNAEAAKLTGLKQKRGLQAAASAGAVAQCNARFAQ